MSIWSSGGTLPSLSKERSANGSPFDASTDGPSISWKCRCGQSL